MLETMRQTENQEQMRELSKMAIKMNEMIRNEIRNVRIVPPTPSYSKPTSLESESASCSSETEENATSPGSSTHSKRSIFTDQERKRMQELFNEDPYPTKDAIEVLVQEFDGTKTNKQIYNFIAGLRNRSQVSKRALVGKTNRNRKRKRKLQD